MGAAKELQQQGVLLSGKYKSITEITNHFGKLSRLSRARINQPRGAGLHRERARVTRPGARLKHFVVLKGPAHAPHLKARPVGPCIHTAFHWRSWRIAGIFLPMLLGMCSTKAVISRDLIFIECIFFGVHSFI